jgi:hypothetical protein
MNDSPGSKIASQCASARTHDDAFSVLKKIATATLLGSVLVGSAIADVPNRPSISERAEIVRNALTEKLAQAPTPGNSSSSTGLSQPLLQLAQWVNYWVNYVPWNQWANWNNWVNWLNY